MREQPSLFITMSPVMAAKLTMCFRERSWLDKSLCGRRCVLSTPNHLYCDLSQVEDPPLTGTRKYVLNGWLVDQLQAEPKRKQNFLVQFKKEDSPSPKSRDICKWVSQTDPHKWNFAGFSVYFRAQGLTHKRNQRLNSVSIVVLSQEEFRWPCRPHRTASSLHLSQQGGERSNL